MTVTRQYWFGHHYHQGNVRCVYIHLIKKDPGLIIMTIIIYDGWIIMVAAYDPENFTYKDKGLV